VTSSRMDRDRLTCQQAVGSRPAAYVAVARTVPRPAELPVEGLEPRSGGRLWLFQICRYLRAFCGAVVQIARTTGI
jgi:hypothetical protein